MTNAWFEEPSVGFQSVTEKEKEEVPEYHKTLKKRKEGAEKEC